MYLVKRERGEGGRGERRERERERDGGETRGRGGTQKEVIGVDRNLQMSLDLGALINN